MGNATFKRTKPRALVIGWNANPRAPGLSLSEFGLTRQRQFQRDRRTGELGKPDLVRFSFPALH